MKLSKIIFSLLCGFMAGCATPYVQPSSTESAGIRVAVPQSKTFASVGVLAYPSGNCEAPMDLGMIGGMARLSTERSSGIPGADQFETKTSIERLIASGAPYMISVRAFLPGKTCVVTLKFSPVRGENYEALVSWDANQCYVNLKRLSIDGSGLVTRTPASNVIQAPKCEKGFN